MPLFVATKTTLNLLTPVDPASSFAVWCRVVQGNWVADEVLFQARIHPETAASALSSGELEALRQAVVDVCALAVSVGADDKQFPPDWLFHSRWHKAGGVVLGHPVSYITVNGRTSAFVPALQKKKAGAVFQPCFAARALTHRLSARQSVQSVPPVPPGCVLRWQG